MSDEQPQSPPRGRRSSFAGQTFADLFGGGRSSVSKPAAENNSPPPTSQLPGPISQAAQQAQRRRLSLTTLGLSGSPNQTSPFNSIRGRGDSIGSASANSGSIDESAIAEDDGPSAQQNSGSMPPSPFARRTSFGARALRDIRGNSFGGGGGGGGPGSPGQNGTRSPPASSKAAHNGMTSSREAKGRGPSGEGFNWSDNFRTRAERTSIAAQGSGSPPVGGGNNHSRAKSVAVMEPPPAAPPKPKEQKRPDHFQERILKGDFYMD